MTYIQPNSIIDLYSGIPLDPDYNDTVYFASSAEQTKYFDETNKRIQRLTEVSYVRRSRNTIRFTPNNWSMIIHCNYLRFSNTRFENKWFYAFVTKCEYINNSTCEITFSIDVMQTWFFGDNQQIGIKKSFVIRQHDDFDVIGGNIEPEPIELSEYVSNGKPAQVGANKIGFIVAVVDTNQQTQGQILGGIYTGATLTYFTSAASINNYINKYLQHPESVLAIYVVPEVNSAEDGSTITQWDVIDTDISVPGVSYGETLDENYKPRNNKCYTYPYTFIRAFTYEGNYADFRYEFFTGTPRFSVKTCIVQPVKSALMPVAYKQRINHNDGGLYDGPYATEGISISSYPVCSWNSDTYATWVAQNSVPMNNLTRAQEDKIATRTNATRQNQMLDIGTGAASAILSLLLGNLGKTGSNIIGTVDNVISSEIANNAHNKISNIDFNTSMQNAKYTASIQADTIHGTISSGNVAIGMGKAGFYAVRMTQPYMAMQKIDSYFDMYGYAVNRMAGVNLKARPHWTYCRVSDIQLAHPFMPADELSEIKAIFENGIRFWVKMDELGNFDLDNSVPR